jgi:hypothetical protein
MIHIVTSDIEWNNIYSGNRSSSSSPEQITDNKKRRNQDLVNYESRYKNKRIIKTNQTSQIKAEEKDKTEQLEETNEDHENTKESDDDKSQTETIKNITTRSSKLRSAMKKK